MKLNMINDLTLVIPAKKEAESLPRVIEELKKYNLKYIISLEKQDVETIKSVISYKPNFHFQSKLGYGNAITECIKKVSTKYFCIFNADGSFDPKEISPILNYLEENNFNIIFASRYLNGSSSEDDTALTFIGNKIFSTLGKILFKLNISDILYTFVIGETKTVNKLNIESNDFGFCVELPIKSKRAKLKISDYPSHERKRIAGKKKVNEFKDGYRILMKMLILFFKNKF